MPTEIPVESESNGARSTTVIRVPGSLGWLQGIAAHPDSTARVLALGTIAGQKATVAFNRTWRLVVQGGWPGETMKGTRVADLVAALGFADLHLPTKIDHWQDLTVIESPPVSYAIEPAFPIPPGCEIFVIVNHTKPEGGFKGVIVTTANSGGWMTAPSSLKTKRIAEAAEVYDSIEGGASA